MRRCSGDTSASEASESESEDGVGQIVFTTAERGSDAPSRNHELLQLRVIVEVRARIPPLPHALRAMHTR